MDVVSWLATLLSVGLSGAALWVAILARRDSKRSADAAGRSADAATTSAEVAASEARRSREITDVRWKVGPHPYNDDGRPGRLAITNVGTTEAREVKGQIVIDGKSSVLAQAPVVPPGEHLLHDARDDFATYRQRAGDKAAWMDAAGWIAGASGSPAVEVRLTWLTPEGSPKSWDSGKRGVR